MALSAGVKSIALPVEHLAHVLWGNIWKGCQYVLLLCASMDALHVCARVHTRCLPHLPDCCHGYCVDTVKGGGGRPCQRSGNRVQRNCLNCTPPVVARRLLPVVFVLRGQHQNGNGGGGQ